MKIVIEDAVNLNDVIDLRREEELENITCKKKTRGRPKKENNQYELRAYYLTSCVAIAVDNTYIKSKGKKMTDKLLYPYLIARLKKKYPKLRQDKNEIKYVDYGYFKNNKRVKFESFCV